MVWGCMSSHGVGRLHIVSGTVKAMDYIEILQNKMLRTARDFFGNQSCIFQDDNAPCHRAKIHRLREQKLCSYPPLYHLPLSPAHCRARLQWCLARPGWNLADWGRIVFSDESPFHLCPDDHRRRVWRQPEQRTDPIFNFPRHTGYQQGYGLLKTDPLGHH
ncbi:uncharacterized protein TNCV_1340641 [Trichonephila clavipes]|nr:uncharacterized protein TNCV_1340641 [Trichonephila clavipes]